MSKRKKMYLRGIKIKSVFFFFSSSSFSYFLFHRFRAYFGRPATRRGRSIESHALIGPSRAAPGPELWRQSPEIGLFCDWSIAAGPSRNIPPEAVSSFARRRKKKKKKKKHFGGRR